MESLRAPPSSHLRQKQLIKMGSPGVSGMIAQKASTFPKLRVCPAAQGHERLVIWMAEGVAASQESPALDSKWGCDF